MKMVQNKHKKSKPKKQFQTKKHGKPGDISNFRAQLDLLGLKIIQVTSDGNCFFRALADQLEGNEEEHEKYRHMVVQYIVKNRDMFEPFIEDEVPFDEYCESMEKDGTWAGNMELQAASLVTHSNICIHPHVTTLVHSEFRQPRDTHDSFADVDLTASAQLANSVGIHSEAKTSKSVVHEGAVKMVMANSSCDDAEKVEQVLQQVDGDVDAAIEFLIAEQETWETTEENGVCHENDKNDNNICTKSDDQEENRVSTAGKDKSTDTETVGSGKTSLKVDKKVPRNKVCPCGSKKKYKSCCGTSSGKTRSKAVVDHEAHAKTGKGKQRKKVMPITNTTSCGAYDKLPDMGALCI
ncbi:OTU domain-containing protein 3 [Bienertia sinuspersici]